MDYRFESLDETVRVEALNDLTVDRGVKLDLIGGLTLSGISSPSFIDFLRSNPEFCDAIDHGIIESPECPEEVKLICIHHSRSEDTLARLLCSPATSEAVRCEFKPEILDIFRERLIRDLTADIGDEVNDQRIDVFLNKRLPFFLPVFATQNPELLEHRIDSLIGGVPFTSIAYEWPRCSTGRLMQPIVQINLQDASRILKKELGQGLVQVWARQIAGGWSMNTGWPWSESRLENFEIRLVPESALNDISDPPPYKDMPWMFSIEDFQLSDGARIDTHPCLMIHSRKRIVSPRICSWRPFGSMFPHWYDESAADFQDGSFIYEYPRCCANPDFPSIPNACYLGGFGGGHSGPATDPPYPLKMHDGRDAQLLFNYQSEGDSYTAVNFSLFFAIGKEGVDFDFHHYWYR